MSHITETIYYNTIDNTALVWGSNHLSVDIPSDVSQIIIDMWDNGGVNSGNTYVGIRANSSGSNIYGRAGRAHNASSYSHYNNTSTLWYGLRVNTTRLDGCCRYIINPKADPNYGQNFGFIWSHLGGPFTVHSFQDVYFRWLSVAAINSIQFFTVDASSAISFDVLVRVIR